MTAIDSAMPSMPNPTYPNVANTFDSGEAELS
jgi:hypothetical protein